MSVTSHIPLTVAKQNCMELHHDNWTNAMNYTSTKAEFFPQKRQDTKMKGRFIYEANVHGCGGRERLLGGDMTVEAAGLKVGVAMDGDVGLIQMLAVTFPKTSMG